MTELPALFGTLTAAQLADRLRPPAGGPSKPVPAAQSAGGVPGESVLAEMLKMNSDAYGRPSAQFRAGHVSRRVAPPAITGRDATGCSCSRRPLSGGPFTLGH